MLSEQSKVDIISEIIYDHLKGKHKDKLSKDLAKQIVDALDEEPPSWYSHA